MASVEERVKPVGFVGGGCNLLEGMKLLKEMQEHTVPRKPINSELWHACAGPLVTLPQVGSLVYYFPQGHSEQVAVSTNKAATTQIPKYPNLPPQLLCQVHNVTLHGDKDTDEIYAQISLQPVNSDKDVVPIPDFGMKSCKHPTEFFCKTLTASDTSTHGGFSVPRRAAEKLFPLLDYSMQPPTQELIVRDLHDNNWTFRHIYRGQPKRHLLTTGWSMFVGAKRLRAGDSILFVRDEKSQLLLGVRRANRQQATLPSSVLSTDSMHIGILAAAAHAAANRSPFTIFYNPRACSSEFVIPLAKYRKAVYSTQLSVGMRFGMMFETEESNKRRYMGTITGISDLDPLRWPNSKWRCLQVEWDEPGCGDKRNRVSPWEIETPESLFIFPSLAANMKRPFHSAFMGAPTEWDSLMNRQFLRVSDGSPATFQCPTIPGMWPDHLRSIFVQPHNRLTSTTGCIVPAMQDAVDPVFQEVKPLQPVGRQKLDATVFRGDEGDPATDSSVILDGKEDRAGSHAYFGTGTKLCAPESALGAEPFPSPGGSSEKVQCSVSNLGNVEEDSSLSAQQASVWIEAQPVNPSQLESPVPNPLPQYSGQIDLVSCPPICDTVGSLRNPGSLCMVRKFDNHSESSADPYFPLPPESQELWDAQINSTKCTDIPAVMSQHSILNLPYTLCGLKGFNGENNNQGDIYSYLNGDGSNSGSTVVDPSVSTVVLDDFFALKKSDFQSPCDYIIGNMSANQDVQSQITSASLADSQGFSIQEFADNSGGTSSSNADLDDRNMLQWNQVPPRFRTYTKIQKAGSVGRSIDVSGFKNYDELRLEIERMFGLGGLLNDLGSGWKLVYVDYENDVLLVGDDPWEEFVGCAKCIRILSPPEVKQMGEEGMQLLNSVGIQGIDGSNSS